MDNLTDKHAGNDDMLHKILHQYFTNTSCFWNNVGKKKNTEKVNSQKKNILKGHYHGNTENRTTENKKSLLQYFEIQGNVLLSLQQQTGS